EGGRPPRPGTPHRRGRHRLGGAGGRAALPGPGPPGRLAPGPGRPGGRRARARPRPATGFDPPGRRARAVTRRPLVLLLAVGLDLLAGEPASPRHPVAWIGRGLTALEGRLRRRTVADGAVAGTAVMVARA